MSIPKSNSDMMKAFWHNLNDDTQTEILNNHQPMYMDFLNGNFKGTFPEPLRNLINIDNILVEGVEKGIFDVVKACIELGANQQSRYIYNSSPIEMACRKGHLEIVKFLVDNGANIHINEDYCMTIASANGDLALIKYLTEHGVNIYTDNNYALREAIEHKRLKVIEYLIEQRFLKKIKLNPSEYLS